MIERIALVGACALVAATAAATPALAKDEAKGALPPQVQQLLTCRSITDTAQRLACFDRHSAEVAGAISSRDIVLIDRERARATSRSLFGFRVPDFGGLFGGGEDEVKEIEGTIAAVRRNHEGGWMVRLQDGSTWSQTDHEIIAVAPKAGQKAVVKRGSFGAFFLRVNGQPGVRVSRVG